MQTELSTLKRILEKNSAIEYQVNSLFQLTIDPQPEDFELLVKEVSFSPYELECESYVFGDRTVSVPSKRASTDFTVTFADTSNATAYNYFQEWYEQIYQNGLLNPMNSYLRSITLQAFDQMMLPTGMKKEFRGFPKSVSDYNFSVSSTEVIEFSVTFSKGLS